MPTDPPAGDAPPPPAPQPSGRADARRNRDAVIAAAMRVLADDPDASMGQVAAASGLTRTTVYRHFPTREELLRALIAEVAREADAAARAATAGDPPLAQVMAAIAASSIAIGQRFRYLSGQEALADEHAQTAGDDPMLRWMATAQARGELRDELPPAWRMRVMRSLAMSAVEAVLAGQLSPAEAERLLAQTLVAAYAPAPRDAAG